MSDSDKNDGSPDTPIFGGREENLGDLPPGKFRDAPGVMRADQTAKPRIIPGGQGISLLQIRARSIKASFNKFTEMAKYFHQQVVVVEVENGESQEEAWRRHLLSHPDSATADIKIFHYPQNSSPDPGEDGKKVLQFK